MIATYRDDLSDIEQYVAPVQLQDDPATAMRRLVDICETPGSDRAFAGKVDIF